MQDSIADLQARLTFQEDAIDGLNRTVAMQEQLISRLLRDVAELQGQVRDLSPGSLTDLTAEPPPPHY